MSEKNEKSDTGYYVAAAVITGLLIGAGVIVYINRKEVKKAVKKVVEKVTDVLLKPEQEAFLSQLHPSVQKKFRQLINAIEAETGYSVVVTSGYRSFQKQIGLKAENSSNAAPGLSYHNYGLAIDMNLARNGRIEIKKDSTKKAWIDSGVVAIAKKLGFRWGGDSFSGYYDPVHFDLGGVDTKKLYAKALAQFGNDPNKIIGNQVSLT